MEEVALDEFQKIALQQQTFTLATESPYAGAPTLEIDRSWQDLLSHSNIRVTDEELARSHQTSVRLPEGGGNLAWMEVSHNLHCVVRSLVPVGSRELSS